MPVYTPSKCNSQIIVDHAYAFAGILAARGVLPIGHGGTYIEPIAYFVQALVQHVEDDAKWIRGYVHLEYPETGASVFVNFIEDMRISPCIASVEVGSLPKATSRELMDINMELGGIAQLSLLRIPMSEAEDFRARSMARSLQVRIDANR